MTIPNPFRAIRAGCRVIRQKIAGRAVLVDDETLRQRLEACEKCPELDRDSRQCKVCTCFVDVKAALSTEKCPRRRWTVISP